MPAKAVCIPSRQIIAFPGKRLIAGVHQTIHRKPEKVTAAQIGRCLALPFRPDCTRTLMRLERFEDLPVDRVRALVRGLIIDLDGTLLEAGTEHISPAVVEKLKEIRDKMPVCVFPDDMERLPVFEQLGIPVVKNVPPKTDPRSIDVAVQLYLQNRTPRTRLIYAQQCAVAGDNFLTDGSCRKIGAKFIHVQPLEGHEGFFRTFTRNLADGIARFHDCFR